jgi:hypothetical protein
MALLVLLAFSAGWLLRDCEPPPPSVAAPLPECPPALAPTEAPPCVPAETGPAGPAPERAEPRAKRRLPALAPRDEDADRRALLAWVRGETPSLRSCMARGEPLRVTVRVSVNEGGEIERAALHQSSGELDRAARTCLEQRLRAWRLPEALRSGARELVFAVRL